MNDFFVRSDLVNFDESATNLIIDMQNAGWSGRMSTRGHAIMAAPDGVTTTSVSRSHRRRTGINARAEFARWQRAQLATQQEEAAMEPLTKEKLATLNDDWRIFVALAIETGYTAKVLPNGTIELISDVDNYRLRFKPSERPTKRQRAEYIGRLVKHADETKMLAMKEGTEASGDLIDYLASGTFGKAINNGAMPTPPEPEPKPVKKPVPAVVAVATPEPEAFICGMCGKVFDSLRAVKVHESSHRRTKCQFCNKELPQNSLAWHMQSKHKLVGPGEPVLPEPVPVVPVAPEPTLVDIDTDVVLDQIRALVSADLVAEINYLQEDLAAMTKRAEDAEARLALVQEAMKA